MSSHNQCQKMYMRKYTPKQKLPGDICGDSTLEPYGQWCALHCSIQYQYQVNARRLERLRTKKPIRSTRLREKTPPIPPNSGIEIVIQKIN